MFHMHNGTMDIEGYDTCTILISMGKYGSIMFHIHNGTMDIYMDIKPIIIYIYIIWISMDNMGL